MTTKRRAGAKKSGTVTVSFELPAAVEADEIALCGDFNNWSSSTTKMKRAKSGIWRTTLRLQTGHSYRYRYLLDGTHWENDWSADGYVRNPYGSDDSVVNV